MLTVTNADYADCNGRYEFVPAVRATWAPEKPVFKRLPTDGIDGRRNVRYIFWSKGKGDGHTWVLGGPGLLVGLGGYFHGGKGRNSSI